MHKDNKVRSIDALRLLQHNDKCHPPIHPISSSTRPPSPTYTKSILASYLPINKAVLAYDDDNHILTLVLLEKMDVCERTDDPHFDFTYIVGHTHLVSHMRLGAEVSLTTWPNMQTDAYTNGQWGLPCRTD